MRPFIAALAAAIALAPAAPALAQGKKPPGKQDPKMAEAKKLFEQGAASYTQGNYEAAIDAWQKSYEISKKPLIFESIGNAYERLGDARKAREYLSKWREVAPKEEQELLDSRIKNLEARITREDELEKARQAEAEKAKALQAEQEKARKAEQEKGSGPSIPGVVLMGGGGALIAVGVTLDVLANGRRPDASTSCRPAGDSQICLASAKDGIESSNRLALIGDTLWIAGSAAAAVGLVLVITHKSGAPADTKDTKDTKDAKPPKATTWLAPSSLPGGGGLTFSGRF
ncbi:MAG: tetratricopeptide repeat protein [Byssovorax sp.]